MGCWDDLIGLLIVFSEYGSVLGVLDFLSVEAQ